MQISKAQEAEQMLTFSKMTGIGNDYIYVNCFQETVVNPEKLSIFMSDVRFGVGSDGLVLILPSAPVTTTTTAAPAGVGTTVSTSKTTTTTAAATTEPYARVTSTYDKTVEDAVKKEENRKLNIVGDMTVTPMSKSDIIAAGIDLSDPGNYHCYNYSIEMDFEDVPMIFTKYEAVPSTPSAPEK